MSIKLKISLSVKFIIHLSFFHPFISKLSLTMEFSNSSTLVHHTKKSSQRSLFLYGETFCYLAREATATDAKVIKRLTEAKLVLRNNARLT